MTDGGWSELEKKEVGRWTKEEVWILGKDVAGHSNSAKYNCFEISMARYFGAAWELTTQF
jgi:hypothetical protein